MNARAIRIGERVRSFIRDERAERFEPLALEIFRYQYERNDAYRRLCDARGKRAASISRWTDAPAVPAEAFKHARFSCGEPALIFETSGTREGTDRRGRHAVVDPDLYALSVTEGFRRFVLPDRDGVRILSLVPSRSEAPRSSLAFMAETILERFGDGESGTYVAGGRLLLGALFAALDRACNQSEPVLLFGTSISLIEAMEAAARASLAWSLPPRSRLVDTGGTKGRGRAFDEQALLERYGRLLSIPPGVCVNEYGMTELFSQLYNDDLARRARAGWSCERSVGEVDRRVKHTPHWLRTRVVDPETLDPADEGLILHVDLANCHSVSTILTEDMGRRREDGAVVLTGRRLGAESRGCSIAMDEWLS